MKYVIDFDYSCICKCVMNDEILGRKEAESLKHIVDEP